MKNKNYFKLNLIYFTALICLALVFVLSYFGFIANEWLSSFLIQIVVMAAIPILMYKFLFKKSFKNTFNNMGFKKISFKSICIVIILGFILYFFNSYIATFFSTIISMLGYEKLVFSQTQATINYATFLKEFLLTAILPGICEEILHRGIMLNCAKKSYNTKTVLLTSSLLFGLTHLNINQFFYAAILGYFMGYVNLICDSIYPSIIIHFMNNFLSIYFSYGKAFNWTFANFVNEIELQLASNPVIFVIFTTLSILGILLLYRYLTKLLAKEKVKKDIRNIINCLKLNQLNICEAQEKINQASLIINQRASILNNNANKKASFLDKTLLISAIVLGSSITIFSFIWGII